MDFILVATLKPTEDATIDWIHHEFMQRKLCVAFLNYYCISTATCKYCRDKHPNLKKLSVLSLFEEISKSSHHDSLSLFSFPLSSITSNKKFLFVYTHISEAISIDFLATSSALSSGMSCSALAAAIANGLPLPTANTLS